MLNENEDAHNSVRVEDSAIVGSWWYDLVPNKTEQEITELCNMFKSKLLLIAKHDFEFLKSERRNVTSSVLAQGLEWNSTRLEAYMGQSKKLFRRIISLCANSLKGLNQVERLSSDSYSESSPVQSS